MATRAAERIAAKPVQRTSNGLADLFNELVDSLRAEDLQRQALISRMRAEVERGDRMLAELGIERPITAR